MPLFKYHRLPRRKHAKPVATGTNSMRDELDHLVYTVAENVSRKAFESEMQSFFTLFTRYLAEKAGKEKLDWNRIESAENQIIAYDHISESVDSKSLKKLAVLKVNGGLGTSMGMIGAKSALEVKNDLNFLDLTVRQIEHLNTTHGVDVPLILMTSFNTHDDTLRTVKKYAGDQKLRISAFNQSRYPRILKESFLPCPKTADDDKSAWYPPGHGDLYNALLQSGVLDNLLADGKEYLFVSNSDNLGAVVDQRILQHMMDTKAEFLMEVTDKTKADVKGGTLINYDGSIRLLEMAQVPSEYIEEFKSVRTFKIFNTNNMWIDLRALKRIMDNGGMELDIIVNPKMTEKGDAVIQLETAAGAAIKHFKNAHGINVPRSRFLPVKSCSDLLLIKSDIYSLEHGQLVPNPERMFATVPVIKLGDHFKKIQQFQKRFKTIPTIIDLDHLTVTGDVYFGRNVTLRGTVIVVANEGQRIDIPDGCVLENRLLSGNFSMIEL